jgi:hypothetical protein
MTATFVKSLLLLSGVLFAGDFWQGPFFWQSKKDIARRVQKERYIPVSVISELEGGKKTWWMKGAGLVRAECAFTFEYAQKFDELKKMPKFFGEVSWNKQKTELLMTPQFLGKKKKIKLSLWRAGESDRRRLHFRVAEGPFLGAEGVIIFTEMPRQECEVALVSRYLGDLTPFGSGVLAIAVEGVLHHVANSLRLEVENDWAKYRTH